MYYISPPGAYLLSCSRSMEWYSSTILKAGHRSNILSLKWECLTRTDGLIGGQRECIREVSHLLQHRQQASQGPEFCFIDKADWVDVQCRLQMLSKINTEGMLTKVVWVSGKFITYLEIVNLRVSSEPVLPTYEHAHLLLVGGWRRGTGIHLSQKQLNQ